MEIKMKFIAAGDAIIQRRIQSDFEGYSELTPYINSADARFFNLETTVNKDCFANFLAEAHGSEQIKRFSNQQSFLISI